MARLSKYRGEKFGTTALRKLENDNFKLIGFSCHMRLLQDVRVCTGHSHSKREIPSKFIWGTRKNIPWNVPVTNHNWHFQLPIFLCWLRNIFCGSQLIGQEVQSLSYKQRFRNSDPVQLTLALDNYWYATTLITTTTATTNMSAKKVKQKSEL